MHPAPSIIAFTTLSGAGYGLLILLALPASAGWLPPARHLGALGLGLALLLIVAGLCASTLHLRHPERAWRAFSQWRSSWLSREGVAAVATFVPALGLLVAWAGFGRSPAALGVPTALGSVVTLVCTGQIYASLKPIARWHHPLTTPCYLALALATGACAGFMIVLLVKLPATWLGVLALVLLPLAWVLKTLWWHRTDAARSPATPETATALGAFGKVRLFEPPHTETNYLLNEMGFKIARKHSRKLRRIAVVLGLAIPWLLVLVALVVGPGLFATMIAIAAFVLTLMGTLVERWLFFAEARHTVMLYYGAQTA